MIIMLKILHNTTFTLTTLSTAIDNQFELTTTYIDNNFVNNTTLTTLSTAIDNQFELTTTYTDEKDSTRSGLPRLRESMTQ